MAGGFSTTGRSEYYCFLDLGFCSTKKYSKLLERNSRSQALETH